MAFPRTFLFLVFSMLLMAVSCVQSSSHSNSSEPRGIIKATYYPSWNANLPPSAINTTLFTHIFYAFLSPSNVTFKFELSNTTAIQLSNFTTTLRYKYPTVKTLLSIGGFGEGPLFAKLASSSSSRGAFINSSLEVARKFGFDGLDLDWEYPQTPKEMDYFGVLLKEWRLAIRKEAKASNKPQLLLTAAVYFSSDFSATGGSQKYPTAAINKYLNWINVMSYDYHGSWDPSATGAQTAFFDPKSKLSSYYGLRSWLKAGIPGKKLVMGLALYGRTWTLKDPNVHSIGAPAVNAGPGNGILTYSQVEEFNKNFSATVVYDPDTISVYSFAGNYWVTYDNIATLTAKIAYAQALKLRGYFFWALSFENGWTIASQVSRGWILEE
ncbi:class V chitinase CHIT5b-like [Punica granatum]|uniref:Uncharacterized protein n=2 Tax=Punica granatum TaxID=22663 RepID=A0A2I0K808_PUNGR|nr:class V chitinase CHIT5b-like [Punica granatum]PKI64674.1 hypothetical protein CRG98_014890 [Punica granatum]